MCFGAELAWLVPLIASGLGVAGSVITTNEANANAARQAKSRNDELQRVMVRNDALAQQSRDAFANRATDIQPEQVQADQQQALDDRTATTMTAIDRPIPSIPLRGDAPQVVKSEIAKKMAEVFGAGRSEASRLAKLGARGDSWLNSGIQDTQAARDIGVSSNLAAGNLGILPHLQDFAENRAYKPISPFGAILSGLGGALGSYAGSGGVPKAGSYTSGVYRPTTVPIPRPNPLR